VTRDENPDVRGTRGTTLIASQQMTLTILDQNGSTMLVSLAPIGAGDAAHWPTAAGSSEACARSSGGSGVMAPSSPCGPPQC